MNTIQVKLVTHSHYTYNKDRKNRIFAGELYGDMPPMNIQALGFVDSVQETTNGTEAVVAFFQTPRCSEVFREVREDTSNLVVLMTKKGYFLMDEESANEICEMDHKQVSHDKESSQTSA